MSSEPLDRPEYDPASLPIFRDAAPRAGRARGGYSMHPTPAPTHGPGEPVPLDDVRRRRGAAHTLDAESVSGGVESAPVDWALVRRLRGQVADDLVGGSPREGDTPEPGSSAPTLDQAGMEERGRRAIDRVLAEYLVEAVANGTTAPWSTTRRQRTAQALFDEVFGLGRLQPLVDRQDAENIFIRGHDYVALQLTDGSKVRVAPVADSDEELEKNLQWLATRPGSASPRPFSWSNPRLHMKLPGGARLAATAFVVGSKPTVNIRRHRLVIDSLDAWVGRGCMSPACANFLAAAVRAGWSVVVSGPMNAGKTTLVRALAAEIPFEERIGTFETEYELFLEETGQHAEVIPWEARPGMGEVGPDGRPAGEFTLAQALDDSFRFSLDRQIVGEVRGAEAWVMIKAMESGKGSLSTTHAANAHVCMSKLAGCAAESRLTDEASALRKLSRSLNVVVQLAKKVVANPDGTTSMRRWVSEVAIIEPGEQDTGYALTYAFGPDDQGPAHATGVLTSGCPALVDHGFDRALYQAEAGAAGGWRA